MEEPSINTFYIHLHNANMSRRDLRTCIIRTRSKGRVPSLLAAARSLGCQQRRKRVFTDENSDTSKNCKKHDEKNLENTFSVLGIFIRFRCSTQALDSAARHRSNAHRGLLTRIKPIEDSSIAPSNQSLTADKLGTRTRTTLFSPLHHHTTPPPPQKTRCPKTKKRGWRRRRRKR